MYPPVTWCISSSILHLQVIHLIRDPRAILSSIKDQVRLEEKALSLYFNLVDFKREYIEVCITFTDM